jgi:hypothetical protein
VDSGQETFDRDLDSAPGSSPRIRLEFLAEYQRIVVNPFLGILAWVGMVALASAGVRRRNLTLFLLGMGLLFIGFLVQQFHCLDCGATGWLYRFRRHACPSVVARYEHGEVPRFRLPNIATQVTIWIYFLAGVLFVALLVLLGARQ